MEGCYLSCVCALSCSCAAGDHCGSRRQRPGIVPDPNREAAGGEALCAKWSRLDAEDGGAWGRNFYASLTCTHQHTCSCFWQQVKVCLHPMVETGSQAGWLVAPCCLAASFSVLLFWLYSPGSECRWPRNIMGQWKKPVYILMGACHTLAVWGGLSSVLLFAVVVFLQPSAGSVFPGTAVPLPGCLD